MATQGKIKLEYEIDFKVIGLFSNAEDFKLCWLINNQLQWQLERNENLPAEKETVSIGFFDAAHVAETADGYTMFSYIDEDNFIENYLLANLSNTGFLIPEYKQCNYFLLLRGDSANDFEIGNVLKSLQEIDIVSSAFSIDVNTIKDLHSLMF